MQTTARRHRRPLALTASGALAGTIALAAPTGVHEAAVGAVGTRLAAAVPAAPECSGGAFVALADGDFLASTYVDGELPADGTPDLLSVLPLDIRRPHPVSGRVQVSNSVTGSPTSLDATPDGRHLVVAEALGRTPPGATQRDQLPSGHRVSLVDITDPARPRTGQALDLVGNVETVDVNPAGDLVAVSSSDPEHAVTLLPLRDGRLGTPTAFSLRELGIAPDPTRFQDGMAASLVQWSPTGRQLAVNLYLRDQVAFYSLGTDHRSLTPWQRPVTVGPDPFSGRFTPDGRHYLTSNWGRRFGADVVSLEQRLPQRPGTVSVIRLAPSRHPGPGVRGHQVVSTATTDISPEGITISPDGRSVVTVNMRGTVFTPGTARFSTQASLTLLRLNPRSGRLEKVDDYPFDGVLPEAAAFDSSGRCLAVTVFDQLTSRPAGGLDMWRLDDRRAAPRLLRTGPFIDTGRGTHGVVLVP